MQKKRPRFQCCLHLHQALDGNEKLNKVDREGNLCEEVENVTLLLC